MENEKYIAIYSRKSKYTGKGESSNTFGCYVPSRLIRTDDEDKTMYYDYYLYSDGTDAYFMNLSDYEQFTMPVDSLGDQMKFLAPEMTVKANFVEGQPVSISLPKTAAWFRTMLWNML